VIGSGGREHALVWALRRSKRVTEVYSPSTNAGIEQLATKVDLRTAELDELADFAQRQEIDLTIVGPEQPLVDGLADVFAARGLAVFGPNRAAARLEGSKVFAKEFMRRHRIPTARFEIADSADDALAVLDRGLFSYPLVLKADGLAAGKGVIIAESEREARQAVEDLMVARTVGSAGSRLVLEECLTGRELSYLIFTDGMNYAAMPVAQDHKRAFDADRGPNTGGMGAFSVTGLLDVRLEERIRQDVVEPTLEGARADGFPFCGVLYCGLMITPDGPSLLEYNVRLGDPETQAILRRLDSDLSEITLAVARRDLHGLRSQWSEDATTCIVLASAGYPGAYETGKPIAGLEDAEDIEGVVVFQAGTRRPAGGPTETAGGRVLGVTARAPTLEEATERAYQAVGRIHFEGMHYRHDIGRRV
jgi:phosphoribosylamine--glycine ligase